MAPGDPGIQTSLCLSHSHSQPGQNLTGPIPITCLPLLQSPETRKTGSVCVKMARASDENKWNGRLFSPPNHQSSVLLRTSTRLNLRSRVWFPSLEPRLELLCLVDRIRRQWCNGNSKAARPCKRCRFCLVPTSLPISRCLLLSLFTLGHLATRLATTERPDVDAPPKSPTSGPATSTHHRTRHRTSSPAFKLLQGILNRVEVRYSHQTLPELQIYKQNKYCY